MRNLLGSGVFATAVLAGMLMIVRAQAAPSALLDGIRTAADGLKLVERVQYVLNGRNDYVALLRYVLTEGGSSTIRNIDGWTRGQQCRRRTLTLN